MKEVMIGIILLAIAACTPVSEIDKHKIQRLTVISLEGDTLNIGGTWNLLSPETPYNASVPEWQMDAMIEKEIRDSIAASATLTGEIVPLVVHTSDQKEILALARAEGFDAVLLNVPNQWKENPNDPSFPFLAGGLHHYVVCNDVTLRLIRVSDGQQFGFWDEKGCSKDSPSLPWHKSWSEFTEAERQAIFDSLHSLVHKQVIASVKGMFGVPIRK